MRTYPERLVDQFAPALRIVSPISPEVAGAAYNYAQNSASGAWTPSANKPFAIPFRLSRPAVVYKLGWHNGTGVMTDSVDVGIYDTAWARKVSGGGTARSGSGNPQFVDVTDTTLAAGDYYLAMASNGTTANNVRFMGSALTAQAMALAGIMESGTNAYALPDPLTNMVATTNWTRIPIFYIALGANPF